MLILFFVFYLYYSLLFLLILLFFNVLIILYYSLLFFNILYYSLLFMLVILIIGGDNFIDFVIFLDIFAFVLNVCFCTKTGDHIMPCLFTYWSPVENRRPIEWLLSVCVCVRLSIRPSVTAFLKNHSKDFSETWHEVGAQ